MQVVTKINRFFRAISKRNPIDDFGSEYRSRESHIVIGGCGRSGTTLIRLILDSHRRICCGPEANLFVNDSVDLSRLQEKFKLDANMLRELARVGQSRAEFIDKFAAACCRSSGKARWAEKTPRNIMHLDYVFDRFPETRFVHVLRDGRDVACSLRVHPRHRVENGQLVPRNTWKPMEYCAGRWYESLAAGKPYFADPRFHTVRYEGLVADPRATISQLLGFLGEEWDEAVLEHASAESQFRDATTFPQNPEALKPIESTAVNRWRSDMNESDKRVFKSIAGALLIECGYATDGNW